jgi:hypothetical protein
LYSALPHVYNVARGEKRLGVVILLLSLESMDCVIGLKTQDAVSSVDVTCIDVSDNMEVRGDLDLNVDGRVTLMDCED